MTSSKRNLTLAGAGALAILALGAGAGAGVYSAVAPSNTTTVVRDVGSTGAIENASATSSAISVPTVYERTHEGVVDITVTETGGSSLGSGATPAATAEGSGWVYDTKGDIVTNDHVVSGAYLDHGHALERQELRGPPRRKRQLDRSRGRAHLGTRVAADAARGRELRRGAGREPGRRDRQPVRALRDGDERDRERTRPLDRGPEQLHDRQRDPDRRADQPRQLGRAPPERRGPGDRRERADPEPVGRKRGRRLCDPVEHGSLGRLADRRREDRRSCVLRRAGAKLELAARRRARTGPARHTRGESRSEGGRRGREARRQDGLRAPTTSPR